MTYIGNTSPSRFSSVPAVQRFSGNNSTTAFTLSTAIGSEQEILVSVDGVIQDTANYTVSGTTLTFSPAPSAGTNNIFVFTLSRAIASVTHPPTSALSATSGTFSGNVSVGGDLDVTGSLDMSDANLTNVGSIQLDSIAGDADTNTTIAFPGSDIITLGTAGSERVRIDASGNVGIGKTPVVPLDVQGQIRSMNGSVDLRMLPVDASNAGIVGTYSNDALVLYTNSAERMRIDTSGNVGLKTTAPSDMYYNDLVVNSGDEGGITILDTSSGQTSLAFADGTSGNARYRGRVLYDHSNDSMFFGTAGDERMRIDTSGRVMIGNTTEGVAGADELTVGNTSAGNGITIRSGTSNSGALYFSDGTSGASEYDGGFEYNHSSQFMRFLSAGSERMRIDSSGHVGIGNTASGFNAQADNLVVGTGSGDNGITIYSGSGSGDTGNIFFADGTGDGDETRGGVIYNHQTNTMNLRVNDVPRMYIDSSGRVMIGTSTQGNASADDLTVASSGNTGITVRAGTSNSSAIYFSDATSGAAEYSGFFDYAHGTDKLSIGVNQSTKLSIDANGNVVKDNNPSFRAVGTTAGYITTSPVQFNSVTGSGNHNTGNHYNTSTYRFTAPVAGRYLFHVHMGIVRVTVNGGHGYPYLRINAVSLAYSYVHVPTATSYTPANITQVFQLAANDYVDVIYGGVNSGYYGNHTELSFSGYLLG